MNKIILLLTLCLFVFVVFITDLHANEKFKVEGDILYYNTDLASEEINQEINWDDVDYFKKVLKDNSGIKTVYITSWGGLIDASVEIADIIIDYELDTHVKEICFSACPMIFLGGEIRTLEKGAKIGFHRSSWMSEDMKDFYEDRELQEYYGWKNVYDFSSWIYDTTQEDIYKQFKFYLERGIDPSFVIETMKARFDDGWYPRRKELLKANFLTK